MSNSKALQQFVANYLGCEETALDWQPLTGDASFRRYFRIGFEGKRYIAALAPPATEKNPEFVSIAGSLAKANIAVPTVLSADFEQGFLLQDDLGDELLSPKLTPDAVDGWYGKVIDQLLELLEVDAEQLPLYNREQLSIELSYFKEWFIEGLLDYTLNGDELLMLEAFFNKLLDSAQAQPQYFVHRDYHCRNIMVLDDQRLACIDFQDALKGPMTYDAVSIFRDCYIEWPDEQVTGWVQQFHARSVAAGFTQQNFDEFKLAFDFMGLQRHIKVLGIFARLSLRDGKHAYLNDLPLVITYVRRVAAVHGDDEVVGKFADWFEKVIVPLCVEREVI